MKNHSIEIRSGTEQIFAGKLIRKKKKSYLTLSKDEVSKHFLREFEDWSLCMNTDLVPDELCLSAEGFFPLAINIKLL